MNSEDMRNQFPQLMILRTCSVPAYSVPNSDAESSVATASSSAELDREEVDKASPRFVGDAGLKPCIPTADG